MIDNAWTSSFALSASEASDDEKALPIAEKLTSSGQAFFHHHSGAFAVLFSAIDSAIFADNAAFIAKIALDGIEPLPKNFDPYTQLSKSPGPHQQRLRSTQGQMLEMIYIRLADNFLNYIMEIIAECIDKQPNLLRAGKEQIAVETVLGFQDIEALKAHLIERKLISIAYLGIEKQLDWIVDYLGLEEVKELPFYPSIIELVETRNCMVHGRGKVGDKFINAVKPFGVEIKKGYKIDLSVDDLFIGARASAELVNYIDRQLSNKFNLLTKSS